MKRHTQTTGIRRWAGDDLVDLQAESLKVLDAFFEEYGPCVIKGCEVSTGESTSISPGIVALQGLDHDYNPTFKVVPFPGVKNINLPIYLTLSCKTVERAYTDGKVKAIAYNYSAEPVSIKPENIPYLEITNKGTSRFVDVTGITNKLNLDGNGKEVIVTFATPSTRENVSTGEKLSIMFGKICRYFADLKSIAFTGKATDISEDATHRFMTDSERTKLSSVETGANKYVHPSSHPADMITDTSGKVIMTAAERTKLSGIDVGANAYTHPATHPATIITEDATHRFMTDTEKTKLSGVETGANKYVHPSSHSADMITDTSGKVIMTVAERTKLNGIAAGANAYTHPTSHPATMITGDSTHRFVSDSEKSTWNRKMEFACAGVITKTAAKDKYWGSTFSVIKSGTGYYRIKHELNKAHQVLAMCINADGEEGFVTIPYRSLTDFFFATNNTNGRQDMAFFFIIFTL